MTGLVLGLLVVLCVLVYLLVTSIRAVKRAEKIVNRAALPCPDLLVLAGNRHEFEQWLADSAPSRNPSLCVEYAEQPQAIYHLSDQTRIILTGTWWTSPVLQTPSRHELFRIIRERR